MDPLRAYFEYLALNWEASQRPDRLEILYHLLAPFDGYLQDCETILEVGAGTGGMTHLLTQRYPQARIYALDLAHEMLKQAPRQNGQARLIQSDAHRLPFGEQSFAAVLCHNSFPHFRNKGEALLEIKRVLHSGGRLLILHELSRAQVNAIHQNAQAEMLHQDLLPDGIVLGRMLEKAGFKVLRLEDTDAHYTVAAQI